MFGVFLTLLDKWGRPQPGKRSIPSRRPLSVQLLPWFYHGNSHWRDRANRNLPKVQERTLRHRSNKLCRAVWPPNWPFMQKHLVRPQFATGFQKAPFGRRTNIAISKKKRAIRRSWCVPGPIKRGQEHFSCPLLSGPGTLSTHHRARMVFSSPCADVADWSMP